MLLGSGATGSVGAIGSMGPTGSRGPDGNPGSIGRSGLAGNKGTFFLLVFINWFIVFCLINFYEKTE